MTDIDKGSPTPSEGGVEPQREAVERGLRRWLEWDFDGAARQYAEGATHVLNALFDDRLIDSPPKQACSVPPEGWSCSRAAGHEGPCAASPTHQASDVSGLVEALRPALRLLPIETRDTPDYAEATGEKFQAMTMDPEAFLALNRLPELLEALND